MNKRIKKKYTPSNYFTFDVRVINSNSKHPITIYRNIRWLLDRFGYIYHISRNHRYYGESVRYLYPKIRFKYSKPIIYPRYQHCPYKTRLIDDKSEK